MDPNYIDATVESYTLSDSVAVTIIYCIVQRKPIHVSELKMFELNTNRNIMFILLIENFSQRVEHLWNVYK